MVNNRKLPPPGYEWAFRRWYVHPRTKRRIYPRNGKCFIFLVKI